MTSKTETQIAEENIKEYLEEEKKFFTSDRKLDYLKAYIDNHKSSCERFLEFLENKILSNIFTKEKIPDLKQAIKLYSENGI